MVRDLRVRLRVIAIGNDVCNLELVNNFRTHRRYTKLGVDDEKLDDKLDEIMNSFDNVGSFVRRLGFLRINIFSQQLHQPSAGPTRLSSEVSSVLWFVD